MDAQPPVFLLKPSDSLPLVDIAPTIAAAEAHLTGHDQYDRDEAGGTGVVDRSDNLYSDSVGNKLQPRRTPDNSIELVLTGEQMDLRYLCNLAIQGFNALSAVEGVESTVLLTQETSSGQEWRDLLLQLPPSRGLGEILVPRAVESNPADILTDLARRFMTPGQSEDPTADVSGSFRHNCWHIWKRICLTCPH